MAVLCSPVPNSPYGLCGRKVTLHFNCLSPAPSTVSKPSGSATCSMCPDRVRCHCSLFYLSPVRAVCQDPVVVSPILVLSVSRPSVVSLALCSVCPLHEHCVNCEGGVVTASTNTEFVDTGSHTAWAIDSHDLHCMCGDFAIISFPRGERPEFACANIFR